MIMQKLHGMILATSQLPISARRVKMHINISTRAQNAYQWRHNEKVRHDKHIYSQILQNFVFIYYGTAW
jgi:hypothetical protein